MADFCKQCSIELFGIDTGDLKNLGGDQKLDEGCGWTALCEGCGFTLVNDDGECLYKHCNKHGGN